MAKSNLLRKWKQQHNLKSQNKKNIVKTKKMKKKKCVRNKTNGRCDGFKLEGVINWDGCYYCKNENGDIMWNQHVYVNTINSQLWY
jgi:hypothetical protein